MLPGIKSEFVIPIKSFLLNGAGGETGRKRIQHEQVSPTARKVTGERVKVQSEIDAPSQYPLTYALGRLITFENLSV